MSPHGCSPRRELAGAALLLVLARVMHSWQQLHAWCYVDLGPLQASVTRYDC